DNSFKIKISVDPKGKTLTVSDNGIGMNESELDDNLGTIARSGTGAFVESLSGDETKDVGLIGQFGVGFYSAFMVAEKVDVLTRKAGERDAWKWSSDGLGEYTVEKTTKEDRGSSITLHLKKDAKEFLEDLRLRTIVKAYSDHISIPIVLAKEEEEESLNEASAIWTRQKKDITQEQYTEFYRHVSSGYDEPWMTTHWRAEGRFDYSALLFVPSKRPFDLFHPDRKHRVKLYVKKVFITDDCEGLIPEYLRFVKGIVDCEDLPLNVSRELLQKNQMLTSISTAVTKRILNELKKKADKKPEEYAEFWENFGAVLKEGLYGVPNEHKSSLIELVRFRSTMRDGLISLKDYLEKMKTGQENIYYITGETQEAIKNSPHLEGFAAKDIEVLLLSDPIDDFWISSMFEGYEEKQFSSITKGSADLDNIKDANAKDGKDKKTEKKTKKTDVSLLIASIKLTLGESVKDVKESIRLTDSACCLVADEGDMDMNLERILRQHQQVTDAAPRVLEINPAHPLIKGLVKKVKEGETNPILEDAALLLFDQAKIMDGEPVQDAKAFAQRMSKVMELSLQT
ncbi:MAG: molecular chaperone HtpG, partial [Pseudomonadota bacterium]|nr:molecular chaperone HtpG [Pseudomonadota bacterium]